MLANPSAVFEVSEATYGDIRDEYGPEKVVSTSNVELETILTSSTA